MLDFNTFNSKIISQSNPSTGLIKHFFTFDIGGFPATIEEFTNCVCPVKVEAAREKLYNRYKQLINA